MLWRTKQILTAALLLFVASSLAYFLVSEIRGAGPVSPGGGALEPIPPDAELVVYYLSQGKDCSTCEYIDEYTREALNKYFADELASGRIVWRAADMDQPEHKHFITDYDLYTKSVVLVALDDGEETAHKNLEKIWDHVYDKPKFLDYIRTEVEGMLDNAP